MSKKYLVNIDLAGNSLLNARIQNLAAAPSSPTAGRIYFDTTLNQFGVYSGSIWTYMGTVDLSNYVDKSTAQTIGGVKTFASFPITPTAAPTTDYQAANKKYVDDAIIAAGGYTNENAQDAVGSILTDTSTVDFTYNDAANTITATVLDSPLLGGQNSAYYRSRANHTGTQTASTISDFQTTVSANTDVAANTTARHTHSNKTILDNTTASFTTTDETKIDYLTVTAATNLDDIRTRVANLDAAVVLMGSWDASAGIFPGGGSAQAGASYIVSVAGTVGGQQFSVGDRVLAITDNASTSTYTNNWLKLDYTDQVLSVNGQTGAVVLTTANITDSTDKRYVTDAEKTKLSNLSGTNTGDEVQATTAVQGKVELATTAETEAKTDTQRAVTPASLATFTRKYSASIGDGTATSYTVTHGLGTLDVEVQVFQNSDGATVEVDVVRASTNTVTISSDLAVAANALRVVVIG